MKLDDYHIFWFDKYTSGYRRGATHAVNEDGMSLCGRNMSGEIGQTPVDGGYNNCDEQLPDCKMCINKIEKTK